MNDKINALDAFRLKADRILGGTLLLLLAISTAIGAMYGQSTTALLVGVPAAAMPLVLLRLAPGALAGRVAVAVSFMLFPALMIHLARGMLEMHFGVFVMLAFLVVYCDWRLIVLAAGVIAVHHLGFNFLQSVNAGVYVLPQSASLGIILVHAAFVVFESAVLVYLATMLRTMVHGSALVAEIATRIGDGDLTSTARMPAGQDEMVASVTSMQERLRNMVGEIRANAEAVTVSMGGLTDNSRKLVESTGTQNESTVAIAAAVEELTVSVSHLSDNARDAKTLVGESARSAVIGSGVVRQSVDDMRAIESAIAESRAEIERLGERSQAASRVVQIINEIASQTNLLALNAAIEAARAGEAGRGFAVVSDEVRKLAERTQTSTSEIQLMMNGMEESKNALAARLEVAVERVASGVTNANEADATISRIVADAERVGAVVAEISGALEEQSIAATDIARHVEQITGMTEGSAAIGSAVAREVEDLRNVAGALTSMVARFRTSA